MFSPEQLIMMYVSPVLFISKDLQTLSHCVVELWSVTAITRVGCGSL